MLRLLSIRNFVVVEALDLELGDAFTVLTGETGAGKSILLDALGLLLGDRFELRQLRAGAERAELAAVFESGESPAIAAWLQGDPRGVVQYRTDVANRFVEYLHNRSDLYGAEQRWRDAPFWAQRRPHRDSVPLP